jgi:hypothetical protein
VRIISAATARYAPFAQGLVKACDYLGYPLTLYGLEDDPALSALDAVPFDVPQRYFDCVVPEGPLACLSPYKPLLLLQALRDYDDFLVWMDADAFPVGDLGGLLGVYNIGITLRRPNEKGLTSEPEYDGYINAGVVCAVPSEKTEKFLTEWAEAVPKAPRPSDQAVLSRMFLDSKRIREDQWDYKGCLIQGFPTERYNNYYFDTTTADALVVHVKARKKMQDPDYYPALFTHYFKGPQ